MGSCFRWKKKNSYTVAQVDEYTPQGGKYHVNQDQRPAGIKAKTGNRAATQWAAESRDDGGKTHDVIVTKTDVKHNDVVIVTTKTDAVVKENGFHAEQVKIPTPDSSPPSTPGEERVVFEHVESEAPATVEQLRRDGDRDSAEIDKVVIQEAVYVNHQNVEPDVSVGLENYVRAESPVNIPEVSVGLQNYVRAESPVNIPEVVIQARDSVSDVSDDDREDPVQVREEYMAQKMAEESAAVEEEIRHYSDDDGDAFTHSSTVITETVTHELVTDTETQPERDIRDDQDVLNSYEDIHITDSPAGTWDARLNKDVRAELDEVQRSLDGSRTNSTVSLEARDMNIDDVVKSRDPVVIQRVQFDVPDTDEEDETSADVAVISYSNEMHETHFEDDNPMQITSYETYQSVHVEHDGEIIDNDVNDRLASINENEYDFPGGLAQNEGEIVLPEGYAIQYEEPSSPQRLSDGSEPRDPY